MSRDYLCQIWHKKMLNNRQLTEIMVKMLRENMINEKQAASDLDMPVARVHNWYYKGTGMTALDLLRMIQEYGFIRQAIEGSCGEGRAG